jgi:hypothetical protein
LACSIRRESDLILPLKRDELHSGEVFAWKRSDPAHAGCYERNVDAMKNLADEGFKRPWPPLIKMDAAVKAKVEKLFNPQQPT